MGTLGIYADTDTPYSYEKMESDLIQFGTKPWEQDMKKDMDNHIDSVKKDCVKSQKKYEEKVKEKNEKKKKQRKRLKKKRPDRKNLKNSRSLPRNLIRL
jgi:hypothetical protein